MSQFAPFVDQAVANDRTNFDNTFISYYTWGSVIAMGLDLTLRDRTEGRISLDDFMRALWDRFGKPGTRVPGYVETPYTMSDVKAVLAALVGDAAFANEFFARFIEGRDVVEFDRLLTRAGILMRPRAAGRAWAGDLRWQQISSGVRIDDDVPFDSPAYRAGLERDDIVVSLGNAKVAMPADVERITAARKPGDAVAVIYERRGQRLATTLKLAEDPHRELVAMEEIGQTLTEEQRRYRDRWLGSAY
jgi:predicted metalloprotease with PDZ domain